MLPLDARLEKTWQYGPLIRLGQINGVRGFGGSTTSIQAWISVSAVAGPVDLHRRLRTVSSRSRIYFSMQISIGKRVYWLDFFLLTHENRFQKGFANTTMLSFVVALGPLSMVLKGYKRPWIALLPRKMQYRP